MSETRQYEPQPISQEDYDRYLSRALDEEEKRVRISDGQRKFLRETRAVRTTTRW